MLRGWVLGPPLGLTQTEGDSAYHAQASSSAEGKLSSGGVERALIPISSARSAVPADASRWPNAAVAPLPRGWTIQQLPLFGSLWRHKLGRTKRWGHLLCPEQLTWGWGDMLTRWRVEPQRRRRGSLMSPSRHIGMDLSALCLDNTFDPLGAKLKQLKQSNQRSSLIIIFLYSGLLIFVKESFARMSP